MYLQISDGYARDEGIYVLEFIRNGLWILLIGCILCGMVFLNVFKIKNGKLSIIIPSLALALLILFASIITFGWFISYNQVKNSDIQSENISLVTLEELREIIDTEDRYVTYIGGKTCSICEHVMPDFQEFVEGSNLDVLYL